MPPVIQEIATDALTALRIVPDPADQHDLRPSQTTKRQHIHLNFITVPLVSVFVLLVEEVFDGQTLRDGVLGTGVQPLNIMALFISLNHPSDGMDILPGRRDANGSTSRSAGYVDGDMELHDLSSRARTFAPSQTSVSDALSLKHKHKHSWSPLSLLALLSQPLSQLAAVFLTATHLLERLSLALVPFAPLIWVAWMRALGVLGAVGGMDVPSCLLCNTNIGATILLARVL
ncbi:hypothetical protein GSI_09338 [Ganoderma sinense ZZ0214-1]|uniref:Uncharacterized protein n=1 Tax=Ganoderma sinense ZZ0214-1 TaxID=1077348 RepID=A0A2G8S6C2_9APHY|nr:hypothetical protein GSI_09338 [Ganoderma sinense ZZ0214-1]